MEMKFLNKGSVQEHLHIHLPFPYIDKINLYGIDSVQTQFHDKQQKILEYIYRI